MLLPLAATLFIFGFLAAFLFSGALFWFAPLQIGLAIGFVILHFFRNARRHQGLPWRAEFWTKRRQSFLFFILLCFVTIVVNIFVARHNARFDVSEEKIHQLSEQSRALLQQLSDPVEVLVFRSRKSQTGYRDEKLLRKYAELAPKQFRFEYIDPILEPARFQLAGLGEGDLALLRSGEGAGEKSIRLQSLSEEALSGALFALQAGEQKKIYFLQGHDEPDIDSGEPFGLAALRDDLQRENIQAKKLLLGSLERVPEDAAVLVLVSPKKQLLPEEENMIFQYINSGGSFFLFVDPSSSALNVLAPYGVRARKDLVVDNGEKGFGAQIIVSKILRHLSTERLLRTGQGKSALVMTMASSLESDEEKIRKASLQSQVLFQTSALAWGEQDFQAALEKKPVRKDDFEAQGVLDLGVVLEGKSKIALIGDSDWILNANRHWFSNRDALLNLFHWGLGDTNHFDIRPKALRASREQLSERQLFGLSAVTFLLCQVFVFFGLWVSYRRQHAGLLLPKSE